MNFSKTTSYALLILNFFAEHPGKTYSAKELNKELGIPWQYLRHLLTELSHKDFIISTQGRNGGFSLQKSPGSITLAEIVDAVEGLESFNRCVMGFKDCPFDNKCAMHETWHDTRSKMIEILQNTTLDSILNK